MKWNESPLGRRMFAKPEPWVSTQGQGREIKHHVSKMEAAAEPLFCLWVFVLLPWLWQVDKTAHVKITSGHNPHNVCTSVNISCNTDMILLHVSVQTHCLHLPVPYMLLLQFQNALAISHGLEDELTQFTTSDAHSMKRYVRCRLMSHGDIKTSHEYIILWTEGLLQPRCYKVD